jgi:copper resistance protein C
MRALCVYSSVTVATGLTLLGGGTASAHSQEIGTSPATRVVARAPLAVSVTFDQPLRPTGIVMQVLGPGGVDFGQGRSTVFERTTLRREMKMNSPAGAYLVRWAMVSMDGHQQSGQFEFTAARGNAAVLATPTTPGSGGPSGVPSGAPSAVTGASPAVTDSARPFGPPSPTPLLGPGQTGSLPGALPAPKGDVLDQRGDGVGSRSVFTYLPLGLGAVLVVAAGLISLVGRRRVDPPAETPTDQPLSR